MSHPDSLATPRLELGKAPRPTSVNARDIYNAKRLDVRCRELHARLEAVDCGRPSKTKTNELRKPSILFR